MDKINEQILNNNMNERALSKDNTLKSASEHANIYFDNDYKSNKKIYFTSDDDSYISALLDRQIRIMKKNNKSA